MRTQFIETVSSVFNENENVVLLLGDIGVYGFRTLLEKFPKRALNIGILEQATVSVAAGMSMSGLIPIVHTIAPFLIERAFEQIKIDFGYQKLSGNLVSVGASYDYAALGCTHHCPGDVALLQTIPGAQIIVPGHKKEFDYLFKSNYNNTMLSYFRLSELSNDIHFKLDYNRAKVVKTGSRAVIVVVGPLLSRVLEASREYDVTVIYYNTVSPFDSETLYKNVTYGQKIISIVPFYESTITHKIIRSVCGKVSDVRAIGVPIEFADNYGSAAEHDNKFGLDVNSLKVRIGAIL
ncbi:MAG: hypothetical protein WCH10_02125 [bacterium]